MKQTLSILSLVVMLLLACASCAGAEVAYQKNYFELTLPDGWKYNSSANAYDCTDQNSTRRFKLLEYSDSLPSNPSVEEIVAATKDALELEADYSEWETITVDGHETALFTLHRDGTLDYFVTPVHYLGHVCYVCYYTTDAESYKSEMLNLLQCFHHRTIDDVCFFRFGDAEVKVGNHRTVTVGGKRYLLVELTWRNVGEKAQMYVVNVDVTAYQDGIELQDGFLLGVNTEVGTSIMPGKELTCTEVFQLRSKTGEITLIVDKLLDFKDEWPSREYNFTLK